MITLQVKDEMTIQIHKSQVIPTVDSSCVFVFTSGLNGKIIIVSDAMVVQLKNCYLITFSTTTFAKLDSGVNLTITKDGTSIYTSEIFIQTL